MTTMRPPGATASIARGSVRASTASSSLTAILRAWNTRRAGWPRRRRTAAGRALPTAAASSPVVAGRASSTARAIRRAKRPSPLAARSAARSASLMDASSSAAVGPADGSMRMSSGASTRYEKPRAGRSNCGELTPRSSSTPDSDPAGTPISSRTTGNRSKRAWRTRARGPNRARRAAAAATASGSRSMPTTRRCPYASSRAAACPPPPTVPSSTTPAGTGAKRSTISPTMTGSWANSWRIRSPSTGRRPSGGPGRLGVKRAEEESSTEPVEGLRMSPAPTRAGRPARRPPGHVLVEMFAFETFVVSVADRRARAGAGAGTLSAAPDAPSPVAALRQSLLLGPDLLVPAGRVPQLDPVDGAVHEDIGPQASELPQVRRDGHAPLGVEYHLGRIRRPHPGEVAVCPSGRRPLLHHLQLSLELLGCPHGQAAVVVLGEEPTPLERRPEASGQDHPSLAVEGVLVAP